MSGDPVIAFGQQPCGFFPRRFLVAKIRTARRLQAEIGGHIDAFYYAPQHPEASLDTYRHPDPPDRKPNPGMILRALADHRLDPADVLLVGDKARDLEAARRAGVRGVLFDGGDLEQFLAGLGVFG